MDATELSSKASDNLNKILSDSTRQFESLYQIVLPRNLFKQSSFVFVADQTEEKFVTRGFTDTGSGDILWQGTIGDSKEIQSIAFDKGFFAGKLKLSTGAYSFVPLSEGVSALVRTAKKKTSSDGSAVGESRSEIQQSVQSSSGITNLDIAVFYTIPVNGFGGVDAIITAAMSDFNTALANTRTGTTVTLAYKGITNYFGSLDVVLDNNRLKNPNDGWMDYIHTQRNIYGADVVILVVLNSTSGYNGWAGGLPAGNASSFVTVVMDDILTNDLFAHEVGHLMGGGT